MTIFTWFDTWPIAPANCLVMFRNGTTILMLNAMPEMLMLGTSVSSSAPPTRATSHIHYVADVTQQGHQNIGEAVAVAGIEEDLAVYFVEIRLWHFPHGKTLL